MIFDEKYYAELEGGILEGLGLLFGQQMKLLVYPAKPEDGSILTAEGLEVAPRLRHLYSHLYENGFIQPIRDFDAEPVERGAGGGSGFDSGGGSCLGADGSAGGCCCYPAGESVWV